MIRWKVIEAPDAEPIGIDEARRQIEAIRYAEADSDGASADPVDQADDEEILLKLGAAREHCENFLGLSLARYELEAVLDEFPQRRCGVGNLGIELPMGPAVAVLSMTYGDGSDATTMDEDADFILDTYAKPSRLMPSGAAWPSAARATNTVKVRYLAGYGVDSDGGQELPKVLRQAIKLVFGDMWANRENAGDVQLYEIPLSAQNLMRPLRVRLGMA